MMKVGIDALSFYVPHYYLDLATLAKVRKVASDKFHVGLGQYKMSVAPPDEDIVTMAANAALQVIQNVDLQDIDTVIFATESGIDYSKAAGIYVHKLLGLPARCRVIELKQACYSSTAGLQMAMTMLNYNPKRKILLIASDIARYGLNAAGESSQGAGAVAMLLTANPRLLVVEPGSGFYTEDIMDFWRPNYREEAIVAGKYSCEMYTRVLIKTWKQYHELTGRDFSEHDYFCYHVSVPKLVEKAHKLLAGINGNKDFTLDASKIAIRDSLNYNRIIGNCYTASLYVSLLSLLENSAANLADTRIGIYSYGSGCVGEFFSAKIGFEYTAGLFTTYHQNMLQQRTELTYEQYEDLYSFQWPVTGELNIPEYKVGKFRLTAISNHQRIYERL